MMEHNSYECDCYIDVDRMINEGLAGGFIDTNLKAQQMEPKQHSIATTISEGIQRKASEKL